MKKRTSVFFNKKQGLLNGSFLLLILAGVAFYASGEYGFIRPELALAILLSLTLLTYLLIRKAFLSPLKKLGKMLKASENKGKDEVELFQEQYSLMQNNIDTATEFIRKIEKGELDAAYTVNENSLLGASLLSMREHLKEISVQEKERIWISEGLTKFSDLLRENDADLQSLCLDVLSHLIRYIRANQGALFIKQSDEHSEEYMEMVACYAYNRRKHQEKKVMKGEGLVGQVWIEHDKVFLTDVPQDYIAITSGLGNANPNCVLIVPLKVNEEMYGVLELASFSLIEKYQVEFIEKLAESLASTISMVKVNERTRRLLEESQELTEQMRAQEEEMRQNLEELTATQEELQRKEGELDRKLQDALKEIALGQINQQMNEIALQITHSIESTKSDLKFLSNVPPVQGLVRALANDGFDSQSNSGYDDWIERMDTIFRNFLTNKELFQSIAFTDENGKAIFQLSYQKGELVQKPEGRVDLRDQEIFMQASGLQKGEVYVGQIGHLTDDEFVMEFGMAIFNEEGAFKGTLLVNLFAESIIEGIKAKEDGGNKYSLLTSEGVCVYGNSRNSTEEGPKKHVVTNQRQNLRLTILHQ